MKLLIILITWIISGCKIFILIVYSYTEVLKTVNYHTRFLFSNRIMLNKIHKKKALRRYVQEQLKEFAHHRKRVFP